MPTKTCPVCGKDFTIKKKHKDKVFCSRPCFATSRQVRSERTCIGCGIVFMQRSKEQKYCTMSCGAQHRPRPERDPDKRVIRNCVVCGKEYEEWTYRNSTCCSKKCASSRSAGAPKLTARKPENYYTVFCEQCGKEYVIHRFFVEVRRTRFCSRKCQDRWVSENIVRENHPRYIGGARFPDRGANWSAQRKAAYRRDGGLCQLCKHKAKRVDVHHIQPYRLFNGDYLTANALSNLITLCRGCHTQVEHYGAACPRPLL